MEIRIPSEAQIGFTGGRGLAYDPVAYAARPGAFELVEPISVVALARGVDVKAGQETPVPVSVQGMPANANVQRITATFTVIDGATETSPPTKVSIKEEGGQARAINVGATGAPALRNVQVKLQGGPVIWTHGGSVPVGTYQMPDFSKEANAYLDQAKVTGSVVFRFQVTSETDGTAAIAVNADLQFTLLQSQSWKNEMDATVRVDRNLQLDYNSVEVLSLDAIQSPGSIARAAIRMDVGGKFTPDRLLGDVVEFDGRQRATISPDFSLAQQVSLNPKVLKQGVRCSGVTAYLECDGPTEIYVEVQSDAGGVPSSGAPLAKSNVKLAPPEKGAPQLWTFAPFAAAANLNLDTPYWVVVKAVRGAARLGLKSRLSGGPRRIAFVAVIASTHDNGPVVVPGDTLINRGGDRWKKVARDPSNALDSALSAAVALVSLIYVPGPDNQTAAVQLRIQEGGAEQRLDPAAQPKAVSIELTNNSQKQATLVIRSHARGLLTVANVVQEYRVS